MESATTSDGSIWRGLGPINLVEFKDQSRGRRGGSQGTATFAMDNAHLAGSPASRRLRLQLTQRDVTVDQLHKIITRFRLFPRFVAKKSDDLGPESCDLIEGHRVQANSEELELSVVLLFERHLPDPSPNSLQEFIRIGLFGNAHR